MRVLIPFFILTVLLGVSCLAEEKAPLDTEKAKINYSVGYQLGSDFKHQGVALNSEALLKGIENAFFGSPPLMTAEEQRAALIDLQQKVAVPQKKDDAKQVKDVGVSGGT